MQQQAVIVGAGLAGLSCASHLHQAGLQVRVLEAADDVGGRAQTDVVNGFLLDRGFQVLLTAYPEARTQFDLDALKLHAFEPGALVRCEGKFQRFADPWRRPSHAVSTALSPVGTWHDKWNIARLRRQVSGGTLTEIYSRPDRSTLSALQEFGFSSRIIERFFRPFLGGVFLERELKTSSRFFEFVFRMFAHGDAVLPEKGMGAMAQQLASHLPEGCVRLNTPVEAIENGCIRLSDDETLEAEIIVIATDLPSRQRLLDEQPTAASHGVRCHYFVADRPPIAEPILVLNGEGEGPINNLCVPSQVCPSYAPPNQSLVSVTCLDAAGDEDQQRMQVFEQLRDWFGADVDQWRHLRTYPIRFALPAQLPGAETAATQPTGSSSGLFFCGDYVGTASINGALASGRETAEAVRLCLTGTAESG